MTERSELSDWLAGRPVDQLAELIDRRPDSSWGAPLRGLDDLAARLSTPESVMEAVMGLALPAFELLQVLAALGRRPTVSGAAALLDSGVRSRDHQTEAVIAALTMLEASALAWRSPSADADADDRVELNAAVRILLDRPLGLGRPVATHLTHTPVEQLRGMLRSLGLPDATRRDDATALLEEFLTDPVLVRNLLATAPASTRQRLTELVRADDIESLAIDHGDREGENWARRRGLLFGGHYYRAEVPIEVALAMLTGAISIRFTPDPPALPAIAVDASSVRAGAAAAAAEFTETVAAVLDSMARSPLPELKSGGVGTREVARLAKAIGLTDGTVRFALELIRALGLLSGVGSRVGISESAARWRASEPGARFADLAVAWWGLPITASQSHDPDDGKAIPAIGRRSVDGSAIDLRHHVIATTGALPAGTGAATAGDLVDYLNWHRPGQISLADPAISMIWAEAHAIGVLAQGVLTAVGSALLQSDPEALLAVAADLLPPATTAGRFGSDLTVMVAGSPTAAVSRLLDSCADRESRGAAVVWRFSPSSIRRAMDEGASSADLLTQLTAIADTDLPQTLTYLIGDVARRHGTLVVQPALCCLRSDDTALLIEVAAHRSLRTLRPCVVAPTVIAFQAEPRAVLDALRRAGYLPVGADEHGVVVLDRLVDGAAHSGTSAADDDAPVRMVEELRHLSSLSVGVLGSKPDPAVRELAAALLSAAGPGASATQRRAGSPTPTEAQIEAFGAQLTDVERRQLAFAIDQQAPVSITYQSSTGGTSTRTISDIELVSGLMYAWCHLRDDERVFAVDRVRAVTPVHR